jgi:hypothetical protein
MTCEINSLLICFDFLLVVNYLKNIYFSSWNLIFDDYKILKQKFK